MAKVADSEEVAPIGTPAYPGKKREYGNGSYEYIIFETPGGVLGFLGRQVCFIFFFFLISLSSSGS
ncbi:MAG: hypothetical protein GY696_35025 [Gammaproteobacteria bacterium]|nr:hypothetical protein [Gammaproteobacteria bacterium]